MDHRVLVLVLMVWSSGLRSEDRIRSTEAPGVVRLVGGSGCAGTLEETPEGIQDEDLDYYDWNLTSAAAVCRRLDCGSVVSLRRVQSTSDYDVPFFRSYQLSPSSVSLEIVCSDWVRLVNGSELCSGRVEVKSDRSWSPVCDENFDMNDAQVVCRELGCGDPSLFKGALYGEVESPVWTKEFQCGGQESALQDCDSTVRNTCDSGKAVGLTCSEPSLVRLVGEASRCRGTLEMRKQDEWKPVDVEDWNLRLAGIVCGQLDCGSAVSTRRTMTSSYDMVWAVKYECEESSLIDCYNGGKRSSHNIQIICSDSVRLVNGTSSCSGRLEVKVDRSWYQVCDENFGQQNARVVCRELGCGAPSVFKGGLYGEVEARLWRDFWCDGLESALQECGSSWHPRATCSPGNAVGLTCSDPDEVRLVGGATRCTGALQLKHHDEWRAASYADLVPWDQDVTSALCGRLGCGSPVSAALKTHSTAVWCVNKTCVRSGAALKDCVTEKDMAKPTSLQINCSDSVRLVNGAGLCSGRLEVRSDRSDRWSSVCEDGFEQQDAEVGCRELGCGETSAFQGELFGEEAGKWTKDFHCEGNESTLLGCGGSSSASKTCPSGRAVTLTCSDPPDIRLVGERSRCAGTLEVVNQGQWRPVAPWTGEWDQESAGTVCRLLNCGFAVSTRRLDHLVTPWWIKPSCAHSASSLAECVMLTQDNKTPSSIQVICSDLLDRPTISLPASTDGFSRVTPTGFQVLMGSSFTISCSIRPQYEEEGSFQLIFTSSGAERSWRRLPAVNHSARFPFVGAELRQEGRYSCVYHLHVFSANFSSAGRPVALTVSASVTELMVRLVFILLGITSLIAALCCLQKAVPKLEAGMTESDWD